MDSDQALRLLGKFSKWQIRSYCVYAFGFGVPYAWMLMSVVYIGDTPNYRCAIPDGSNINESIPQICDADGKCEYDQCHMYSNFSRDNTTVECQNGYWFDPASGYKSTLVTDASYTSMDEFPDCSCTAKIGDFYNSGIFCMATLMIFNLVCGNNWLVELSMTINQIGGVLGAFIFPQLSDAFGRKTIFLVCMWSNVAIAFIQAFSVNLYMYCILGFIDGIQQQGMVSTAFILGLELFPIEQRTLAGVAVEFFWAFGYVSLIGMAYFIRNWRHLQLAITVPLSLTVLFYWLLTESVPWLVANKKYKKAEAILSKAAKINKVAYPEHIFTAAPEELEAFQAQNKQYVDDAGNKENQKGFKKLLGQLQSVTTKEESTSKDEAPKYNIKDLFRSKIIFSYSVIQWFIWFTASLGYNAIALTVTYLPGDRYVNSLLYSLIEVPAYIILWVMFHYIGRRIPLFIFFVSGGVALLGTVIRIYAWSGSFTWLIVTLSVLGKMGFTCSFGGVYALTPELYPTNMRNVGLGASSIFARVANFTAPVFRILARNYPVMPSVIIGTASVVSGGLVLILPETRHEPLPDTIEQVKKFKRSSKPRTSNL